MVASHPVAESHDEGENSEPTATLHRAGAGQVRLKLLVLSGAEAGRGLVLEQGEYVVGKAPSCHIVLSDKTISRQHLKLEVREGR
ncbi:MAG TPA: FHA domain-containing protein, partial [Archangium sp.]|uniref:FHA domain-containing protein n=1 Tax=Archangium sp. TaxID=1872627 RepID=UPI002EDA1A07